MKDSNTANLKEAKTINKTKKFKVLLKKQCFLQILAETFATIFKHLGIPSSNQSKLRQFLSVIENVPIVRIIPFKDRLVIWKNTSFTKLLMNFQKLNSQAGFLLTSMANHYSTKGL